MRICAKKNFHAQVPEWLGDKTKIVTSAIPTLLCLVAATMGPMAFIFGQINARLQGIDLCGCCGGSAPGGAGAFNRKADLQRFVVAQALGEAHDDVLNQAQAYCDDGQDNQERGRILAEDDSGERTSRVFCRSASSMRAASSMLAARTGAQQDHRSYEDGLHGTNATASSSSDASDTSPPAASGAIPGRSVLPKAPAW